MNAEFSRIFRTHHNANTLNSNALNFNAPQSAVLNALRLNLNANTLDFSVNSVVLSNASLNSAANSPLFAHFANGGGGKSRLYFFTAFCFSPTLCFLSFVCFSLFFKHLKNSICTQKRYKFVIARFDEVKSWQSIEFNLLSILWIATLAMLARNDSTNTNFHTFFHKFKTFIQIFTHSKQKTTLFFVIASKFCKNLRGNPKIQS